MQNTKHNIDQENISQEDVLIQTYKRFDVSFKSGKNALLIDATGQKYIDFLSGLGVNNLGYCHPKLIRELKKQITKPLHHSNLYNIPSQVSYASEIQKLVANQILQAKTFFCNSGTEANEAFYKLAFKYGHVKKKIKQNEIIILSAKKSFHGRTLASLNLTGQEELKKDFISKPIHVKHFELNNLQSFKSVLSQNVSAVILEIVQGEGGVYLIDKNFINEVALLCKKEKILLFIDEVQTGYLRTGKMFAFQHFPHITFDGFTWAKASAGGLAMGGMTVQKEIANVFSWGDHGCTFGGNPFVTQIACSTLNIFKTIQSSNDFQNNILLFKEQLDTLYENFKQVFTQKRQLGWMAGLSVSNELDFDAKKIVEQSLTNGLLIGTAKDNVIRLLPPVVVRKKYILKAFSILKNVLKFMLK